MSPPSRPRARARSRGDLQALGCHGVFAAHVQVALRGPGRERRYGQRLQHRVRVLLHDHPVLEGARLRLVGVAHHVVGARRGMGHRLPLGSGRECRTPAPHQPGVVQLAQHTLGAQLEGTAQGGVAPVMTIIVKALRGHRADPAQQGQLRRRGGAVGLRGRGTERGRWRSGNRRGRGRRAGCAAVTRGQSLAHLVRAGRAECGVVVARQLQQHRRRALTEPQAGAGHPGGACFSGGGWRRVGSAGRLVGGSKPLFQPPADLGAAGIAAHDVVAHVGHPRWPLLGGQQGVEGGHAVGLGRRHVQAAADVAEGRGADPADRVLHAVQRRQQLVTDTAPGAGASEPDAAAARGVLQLGAGGRGHHPVEYGIDRGPFGGGGLGCGEVQVHQRAASLSTRTAVALNSAVPDLRSQASIVSRLVSTWSGKCRVMNTSPGRNPSA